MSTTYQNSPEFIERFCNEHQGLIKELAGFWHRRGSEFACSLDDYLADASVGLFGAARTYLPEHGKAEESWAQEKIEHALLMGLRQRDPLSQRERERVDSGEMNFSTNPECISENSHVHVMKTTELNNDYMPELRKILTQMEIRIITCLLEGMTHNEVAQLVGVSQPCISNRRIPSIREKLEAFGADRFRELILND